jgi:hypothetical protein
MAFSKLVLLDISSDLTANDVTYYLTVGYTCGTIVAPYSYNSAASSWTPLTVTSSVTTSPCSITFPILADPVIGVFTETPPSPPSNNGGGGVIGGGGGPLLPTINAYASGNQTGYTIANFSQANSETVLIGSESITVVENFITPTTAGITVNGQSLTLPLDTPVQFLNTTGSAYYAELTGISYLPALQTITLSVYGQPNAQRNATSTKIPSTVLPAPTTTVAPATTTVAPTTVNATQTTPAAPANTLLPLMGTGVAIAIAVAAGVAYSRLSSGRKRRQQ